jgi:hypothetical protein
MVLEAYEMLSKLLHGYGCMFAPCSQPVSSLDQKRMKNICNSVDTVRNSLHQKHDGSIQQSLCADVASAAFGTAIYSTDILPYHKQKVEVMRMISGEETVGS